MYKSMLAACLKEKFGRMFAVYYILFGMLTIIIDETLAYGILFTLVIFTAIQMARMFSFQEINCINNGYVFFRMNKAGNILMIALLANIPWLAFMIIKTLMIHSNMLLPMVMVLIWGYSIILGTIAGTYIKKEVINYAFMLLCFFLCIQKILIHELYFRYISPLLVFKGEVNIFNLLGICILSVFGIFMLFVLRKRDKLIVILMMLICFLGLTLGEMKYESTINSKEFILVNEEEYSIEYNSRLEKDSLEHISDVIAKTEKCLREYGFNFKTINYHMNYSIYFPWESNQQKVFIMNGDGICNMNFYAESLCKISDDELITRYIYSRLEQNTQLQEIAAELLVADVISRVIYNESSSRIFDFSYDRLVESYGYCTSPKQCAVAECMKVDSNSFATLYHSFETIQSLNEVQIETLGVSSEYEEIFRRIIE